MISLISKENVIDILLFNKFKRYCILFIIVIIGFSVGGCSLSEDSQNPSITKTYEATQEKIIIEPQTEETNNLDELATQEPIKTIEYISDLLFILESNYYSNEISCWKDDYEDLYYVFLPSYATLDTLKLSSINGIEVNDVQYENSDYFGELEYNKKYKISSFAENGTYSETSSVIFTKSANMPAIFIDTESGNLDYILEVKSNKEKGYIVIVDTDGDLEYTGNLDYFKGRGNYTWELGKKPFNIKLKKAMDLFGMGSAKRWSLLSNYTDQSFIRNKLAYEMAKDVGLEYSVDSIFVDLYLNGEYYGLFQLTERVEVQDNRVEIEDLEEMTEWVNPDSLKTYDTYEEIDEFGYISEKGIIVESNPNDITGGYLVEVDFYNYFIEEVSGFKTDRNTYFAIKSPEYASQEQVDYIDGLLSEFERLLYLVDEPLEEKTSDEEVLEEDKDLVNTKDYLDYIDLDSWVKVYLVHEIFENFDTFRSSQYFYKNPDVNGEVAKIFAGPIWDFDMTMGNISFVENPRTLYIDNTVWFGKLLENETFYNRVTELFESTYLPLLNELVETKIDEYEEYLSVAAKMNYIRWPLPDYETNYYSLVIGEFSGNIDYVKDYLTQRIEFLEDLWVNQQEYYSLVVRNTYEYPMKYMAKEGESVDGLAEPNIEGYIYKGWRYLDTKEPFEPDTPLYEDTDIFAKQIRIADITEKQLNNLGYDLESSPDLYIYLKLLEYSDYTVFISIGDEGTFALNNDIVEEMNELGLETNLRGEIGISYVAAVKNGEIIQEQAEYDIISVSGTLEDGASYEISSSTEVYNSYAKILIDGKDYAINSRGLNIVVYDEESKEVVDSVCFDTYWGLSSFIR